MGWVAGLIGRIGGAKMAAIVFAIAFSAGWVVNGCRLGGKEAKAVAADAIERCSGVDDEAAANGAGVGQVDMPVAAITGMREVAGEMRAQVLALQEKVKADHATINGEDDDKQ